MQMTTIVRYQYLCIVLTVLILGCHGQTKTKREVYNSDFQWTIAIPENFDSVSSEDWRKIQGKGIDAIEKTYDEQVTNQTKTIFVFKSDQMNYVEASYQPFDTITDGSFSESCQAMNRMIYETFKSQMQDIKIDTVSSVETIDNLEFQKFEITIEYPSKVVFNAAMYSRLFANKEFFVNIMYVDSEKGKSMLDSWRKSTFGKQTVQ